MALEGTFVHLIDTHTRARTLSAALNSPPTLKPKSNGT